jgi:hypothetical protein
LAVGFGRADLAGVQVEAAVADRQDPRGVQVTAAQGAQSREELVDVEGLAQVVLGAPSRPATRSAGWASAESISTGVVTPWERSPVSRSMPSTTGRRRSSSSTSKVLVRPRCRPRCPSAAAATA